MHIVFAYATYGGEGSTESSQSFTNNSPQIGNVTAYVFAELAPVTPTTTTLASSPNPSTVGQSVTFTATVSPSPGPTGTIAFTADGATLAGCGAIALASGQAQCATSILAAGSHAMAATYSGDNNYSPSSGALTQVVNPAVVATSTTLVASLNPSAFGQSVTFTATIRPSSGPTGTVAFTADGTTLSECGAVVLASAQAQCSTSTLAVATHAIIATYSGDSNYSGSSGNLSQVVNLVSPILGSFTISATPAYQEVQGGNAATYNLMLTSVDGFAGTVTLSCSGEPLDGTCAFSTGSTVTLAANETAPGGMTVTTTTADAGLWPFGNSDLGFGFSRPSTDGGDAVPLFASFVVPFNCSGLAALLAGVAFPWRRRPRLPRAAARIICFLALLSTLIGISGCGCPSTQHEAYTITITGTSGTQSASATVALLVGQRQIQ